MVRVLAGLALSALALGAPKADPAKLLRVAWASQYEWKEDGVKNVTLEFKYTFTWGAQPEVRREGSGQIVIAGGEVVRRHYPDLRDGGTRAQFDEHVQWVLRRFLRRPFEQVFQGVTFAGPVESSSGRLKITAGRNALFVKEDRLVAATRPQSVGGKRPIIILLDYKTGALGDGYAILGETTSYTRPSDSVKVEWARSLTTKKEAEIPAPAIYSYLKRSAKERQTLRIEFHTVRFNLDDPIVLDPAARDLLKAAWEKRYVLPNDVRIRGQFLRRIDKDLDRARWIDGIKGDFQLWGMDRLQIQLGEQYEDRSWYGEVERTCTSQIRRIFDLVKERPFDEEFKGCGFELEPQGDVTVVRVYGYARALAFKVERGAIVGHYGNALSPPGWWEYKVKPTREGRFLLERMKRSLDGKRRLDLRFRYQRVKGGLQIPKTMDAIAMPRDFRRGVVLGVAEYSFRKPKVVLPDNK